MPVAVNLVDEFYISRDRVTLTEEQLHIPGLRMIGHHTILNALCPQKWQYHENAFEFTLSARGSFVFDTVEKSYPFGRGDVFISWPDEVHGTGQEPFAAGEIYWFQLDIQQQDSLLFLNRDASRELVDALRKVPNHVIHTEISRTLPLLENAFRCALAGEDPHLCAAWLVLFLRVLLTYTHKESPGVSPAMQCVLEHIQADVSAPLPLEELAALAGLSLSQFKLNFKKELGTSPRHFINQKKIDCAKKLLLEGCSVTETAMRLGFSSSNYFSGVFKKFVSLTPSEYVWEKRGLSRFRDK